MGSVVDCSTTESLAYGKCWETIVKPVADKLKNATISFWFFVENLILHVSTMDWTQILTFATQSTTDSVFEQFTMVPLEEIINRANARNAVASTSTPSTRDSTSGVTATLTTPAAV